MSNLPKILLKIATKIKHIGPRKQAESLFQILKNLYSRAQKDFPENIQENFEKLFWKEMEKLSSEERNIYRNLIRAILKKAPSKKRPGKWIHLPEIEAFKSLFIAKIPRQYRKVLKQFAGVS